ncbi:hypothetical protein BaRGS_00004623 [Batillaria attramentaria]|uniref:Uncharacterized protein n=1 Tax=Batillaria attramentaria TaxID=370345 RepID=A0ABD0LXE8_9CAEN
MRKNAATQRGKKKSTTHVTLSDSSNTQDQAFIAKDGTKWSNVPPNNVGRSSNQNVFRVPPFQLLGCSSVIDPVDAFLLFMSNKNIKSLTQFTNTEGKRQHPDTWVETDEMEMSSHWLPALLGGHEAKHGPSYFDF